MTLGSYLRFLEPLFMLRTVFSRDEMVTSWPGWAWALAPLASVLACARWCVHICVHVFTFVGSLLAQRMYIQGYVWLPPSTGYEAGKQGMSR